VKRLVSWAVIVGSVGLFGGSAARACEPILDLLLFSFDEPGKCPVPTTEPRKNTEICLGAKCRSFGGSDKGQFGQFKKDAPGKVEALIFRVTDTVTGNTAIVVRKADDQLCNGSGLIPDQDPLLTCDALFKVKGIRPVGAGLSAPLCTFDSLDDLNTITSATPGMPVIVKDVNDDDCLAVFKPQYWLYYKVCCTPGTPLGNQGDRVTIQSALVIENNNQCTLDPIRNDMTPEVIPQADSSQCI
jgi:hypothetical protein